MTKCTKIVHIVTEIKVKLSRAGEQNSTPRRWAHKQMNVCLDDRHIMPTSLPHKIIKGNHMNDSRQTF